MRERALPFASLGILLALLLGAVFLQFSPCHARSAFSPRHSGLEAPGEGKAARGFSGAGMGSVRTAEGGMGYSDAYGNTLDDQLPGEKKPRKRMHPGAYGHRGDARPSGILPDPDGKLEAPAWTYN